MSEVRASVARRLAAYLRRNGYARFRNADRLAIEGGAGFGKGDEIRLVAGTVRELQVMRRLLTEAGFKPGRPFRKGRQYRQPVCGRQSVARFLELVEAGPEA